MPAIMAEDTGDIEDSFEPESEETEETGDETGTEEIDPETGEKFNFEPTETAPEVVEQEDNEIAPENFAGGDATSSFMGGTYNMPLSETSDFN